ncbi:MAG: GEVED domain-containing protein [Bacteroidales bacterium]
MKKLITLLIPVLLLAAGTTYGQVNTYSFGQSMGTYTSLTGATPVWTGTGWDDYLSASIPLGFTFNINGTNFTSVYFNTNGTLYFGGSGASGNYSPISSSTTATAIVAPVGTDLNSYATNSQVRYKAEGTAPNRTFSVEWYNWSKYGNSASRITFMATLEETSNKIYFKYGSFGSFTSSYTTQVGLRGSANTDFNNRTTTTNWSATTRGTLNSQTCPLSATIVPVSGLTFVYNPIPQPTNFLATAFSTTQINLGWTLGSLSNTILLYNTTGNFTAPTNGQTYAAGATIGSGGSSATVLAVGGGTSFSHTGLIPGVQYFYAIYGYNASNNYSEPARDDEFTLFAATPVGSFSASAPAYNSVLLNWTLNALNQPVMVAFNTTNTFGTPIPGVQYTPGNLLSGGGTVLYAGSLLTFTHSGLSQNTTYYYRIWSTTGAPDNYYSNFTAANVTTPFAALPPTSFVATAFSGNQINLSWILNGNSDPVVVLANTTNTFGPLVSGTPYAAGDAVTGGSTVIYNGPLSAFQHTGLALGQQYFYRIYSYLAGPLLYSNFAATNATTLCTGSVTIPYTWEFGSSITNGCWTNDPSFTAQWQTSTGGGDPYRTPYSGTHMAMHDWTASGYSRLRTPSITIPVTSTYPRLNFFREIDGQTTWGGTSDFIQVQVSTDDGATWNNLGDPLYRYVAGSPTTWVPAVLNLEPYVGQTIRIGFQGFVTSGAYSHSIDQVIVKNLEPPSCASAPVPVDGATGVARNLTLSWAAASDAEFYEVFVGSSPTTLVSQGTVTTTSFTFASPLPANTLYYWQVVPGNPYYNASDCSVWSYTTGAGFQYCPSYATSTADESIGQVVFNEIDNTSPTNCETYTNYSLISTDVTESFSYPISITKIDCEGSGFYGFRVGVFIDFNQNGTFEVPGERVLHSTYGGGSLNPVTVTGTIQIPVGALPGPTGMRIVLVESSSDVLPCGTYTWGETEDYTVNIVPYNKDLKIVSWLTPEDHCELTANELVSVSYTNLAFQTQNNYVLSYYNGSSWVNETVTTPIAPGQTKIYNFTTPADFSTVGEYLCKAAVGLAGDQVTDNDTSAVVKIRNYPVIAVTDVFVEPIPGPYVQNFDDGEAFWYPGGVNNCWELGTPAKTFIDGAASEPNAWVTKLEGDYPAESFCWVESPCFDLSTLLNPIFEFKMKYQLEAEWDGVLLLANIDDAGWEVVGDLYQLTNWYNNTDWNGFPVWSGQSAGTNYVLAKHQLAGAGGSSNVKLRILMNSDQFVEFEGFAFDDVTIYESPILFASVEGPLNIEGPLGTVLDLKIKGGVPPYNTLWSPAAGLTCNPAFCDPLCTPENCQKPIATPTETTIYTAKVWDSNADGADTVYASVQVNVFPQLIVDAKWDATVCDTAYTQIYAMASGGVPPYTYQWDNVATLTDGTIYNPVADPTTTTTYSVTVTDDLGFTAVDMVTITTVSGYPVVDIHPNGATICLGDALQLTATGGMDYLWTVYPPSQAGTISATDIPNPWVSPTISGVKYTCVVSSPCGTASDFVIINVIPKPVVTWNTFSPVQFCVYQNEQIPLTGGMPLGGTYSGAGVHNNNFNPAIAGVGTHTLTYTYIDYSVNECPNTATYIVNVYAAPNVGLSLTDDKHCVSESPFMLSGGNPAGGTYSGIGVEDNMFDPNLAGVTGPGVYAIFYEYTNPSTGCTAMSFADSLYVYDNPVVTWDWDTAVCISALPFALHGGMPVGGTYVGAGVVSSPNFNPALAGPGEHTIYYNYNDDNGCGGTASSVITVYELPSATSTSPDSYTICQGETVSKVVTLTGTPPWTLYYTIDGVAQSPVVTSVTPLGIDCTPGTATSVTEYAIIGITDANGCSSTPTVSWTVYSNENPLQFHVIMNDPDGRYCFGTNGISVGLHASEPGYTYKLYKDGVFTGNTFIGPMTGSAFWFVPNVFEEGTYTVEAISNVGPTYCSSWMLGSAIIGIDTLDVNIYPEFTEICLGGTSILDAYLVNPQISTGPYTFTWAPLDYLSPDGFTSVLANPIATTIYSVTVSDPDGCSATATQTITVNNPPSVTINDGPSSLICDGYGIPLVVDVTFGDSDEILGYLWDPTTDLDLTNPAAPVASPHVATAYTVVVVDGNGCEAVGTHNVLVTPSPDVNFAGPNPARICPGGSITLPLITPTVGSGMYTYLWSPATDLSDVNVQNPVCTATQTTTYSVAVTDAYSLCTTTRTFTVIVNNEMAVQLGDNFDICLGTAANLFANVTSGFAPLSFVWASTPSVPIAPVQNPAVIPAALGTTIVTVTVTDFYGCTATDEVAITAGEFPVAHAGANDTICEGECTTLMGSGGTSYQWFQNALPISPVTAYPYLTVCPPVTTTYELRVTSPCGAALSYVTVVVNPETPLDIDIPQSIFCQNDASITLTGVPTDSNGEFSGPGITDNGDGTAMFAPTTVGTYDITYTYTNEFDCEYSITHSVTVKELPAVAFSDIADVCINTPAFALSTGLPVNGTYAGAGVMGGIFNPELAGLGEHTLTYTVTGVNGCQNSASIVVEVSELPEVFNASVSNGGIYCDYPNAEGVTITLDGSADYGDGIEYSLVLNGFTTGITLPGTGYPVVFTNITAIGTYQVLATNTETGCSQLMNGTLVVDRAELPLVYNVVGGGSYCQGGDGIGIKMENSNYGITYYLYRNNAYTGISHPGVNGPFEFTPWVTAVGTYTVIARNDVSGCEIMMNGSATVSTYPLPFPYFVYVGNSGQPSITACAGTIITIRQNANECGVVYELYHNGVPTGLTRTCANGASFTWVSNSFAPGVYTVVGTRVATGCVKQMNGSATINYYEPVSVITNPVDVWIDDMGDASFTVVAGGYNPGYQWEVSQNGMGPWTPLVNDAHYTGVNAATLYVFDAPYDNWTRNKYRVRISGPCNTINSAPAILYIDPVVNVILNNVTDCAKDTLFVPITFTNSDSINAISLTITYDNTNFTFVNPVTNVYPGYADLNPILNSSNLSILGIGNTIRISYFDLSTSINNGYGNVFEFLKLGFKAANAGGTSHPLHFVTNIPGACELSKISGEILTTNFIDGVAEVVPLPVIVSAGALDNDLCQHENIYLNASATHPLGVLYTWSTPPAYVPVTSTSGELTIYDASPANSGMYYLTVTSSEYGCEATTSFNVTVHPEPQLYEVVLPNGNAACAGSGVEVALTGSEVGVTYLLYLEPNNVTPVEVIAGTGLPITFGPQPVTGTYVVKAISVHGCQRWMEGSVHVQINPLPLWFNVLGGGHYCAGGTGREIRLSGSQLGVQYTLLLNACCCQADDVIGTITGTGSPISFGLQLTPGYYSVVAVNPNTGCENQMIGCIPIVIDPLPTAALVGGASICYGTSTDLTLNLTGKAPWSVVLNDGTDDFTVNAPSNPWTFSVSPSVTTTYTIVSVVDGNNCSNTGSGSATVTVWDLPVVEAGSNSPVCVGGPINLGVTVTGFGPFSYLWSGPNGFTSADENPVIPVSILDNGGMYTVFVTDGHGCVNSAYTQVVVNPLPSIEIEANSPCVGGVLHITAFGYGNDPFEFSWTGPNGFTATGYHVMIEDVTAADAGDYTVTITDNNGCVNTATVTVVIYPLPVVTCNGATVCAGEAINLTADATGNGPFSFYWTGPDGFMSYEQNPVILNAQAVNGGTYTVMVYDAHQCVASCAATVIVNPLPEPCPVLITEPNVYCFGCVPPQISLGCSQLDVTYTLYHNGVATTYVLNGTGQAINFGEISEPGFYTVYAVNNVTGCENWMYGTVEVIEQAPPTATLSGDEICLGETAEMELVLTGDTYWDVVIFDGMHKDTIHVNSSPFTYIPGNGPHILAPTTTTTYTILLVSDRVCYNVGNSATVVVNPLPNKYAMTGGGYYCNGIGVNVGLNGSQVGINYTLHQNGYTLNTVAGTGFPISFGPQGDGVYWAVAYNPITGCSSVMNGQVIIYPNPDLIGYDVNGGGSYCFGGTGVNIYLSGSQLGKEYKLLKDGIYTGVTLIGTGYPLTFVNVLTPGVYTVLLFDPATTCTRTMNGSATVVQRPLPNATISGDATICYGDGTTLHVELTGTAPWTFIINDGINSVVHHTMVSTFDTIVNPTSTRTYVISSVVDMYCQNGGTGSAFVTVNSPTPYVVTGGGSYCAGGQGVVVGLSGSQQNVNYTLLINGVATAPVVAGTGSPISFGYQTVAGNYTVLATSTVDGCSRTMNGVAVVQIVPLPTVYNVTGGGACCVGCTHVFVCLDGSQQGIRYELYINGQYSGIYRNGTGMDFCYDYATVAGEYTIKAVNIASGCWAWMNGSAIVTLYPTAQANISGGGTICLGQSANLTVAFTEGTAPFSFGLSNGITTTTYNGITDNPYTITVTPGSGTHNYTLAWVSDIYGCYNNITTGVATVVVTSLPNVEFVGNYGPYCVSDNNNYTLAGGYPFGGVYSGVGVDNGMFNPAVAGVGSHVITYTYTNTLGCQGYATKVITVYPLPVVDITPMGTYCVNGDVVDVYGTSAGGYFIGPNGLVDLGDGHAQFNPAVAGVGGPYTITYVYTYDPEPNNPNFNGCVNSAFTFASVVALPNVSFTGLNATYCANDPIVELVGNPAGGVFTGPGIVNGNFFDPAAAGVGGPFAITYTVGDSYCTNSHTVYVTVNPLPQECTFEGGGICCIGCSVYGFLNCSEQGVSYQLVRNGNLNIGGPKLGTGFALNWEIFLGGSYQVVATDITTGCTNVMNGVITVEIIPQPTASISGTATICEGQCTPITVTLTGTPPFEIWLSDGADTTIIHNISGYTWTQDVCPTATTTYTVVSLTDEYCGAFGVGSATITVNPMPEVFDVTGGGTICANAVVGVPVGLAGSQNGVYYELFLDGVSTSVVHVGNGNAFDFGLFTDAGVYTVKSMSLSTCEYLMVGEAVISTYPITDVTIGTFDDVCINAAPFTLGGGLPDGGVYFVDGFQVNFFDAQAVGVGSHVITYEYTDQNGCTFSASAFITVNDLPNVSLGSFAPVCFNAPEFELTGGQPMGGIYYVNGIETTMFDPSAYGVGTYTVTYSYTDGNGCAAEASSSLTVLSLPNVQLPQFADIYLNADPIVLTGGTPTGGVYSGDHVTGGMFYPVELGTFVITYTFTDNCGTYTAQSEITVVEGAIYNITGQVTYDNNAATAMNNTTVYLKSGSTVIATTSTDAGGDYAFNLIAPGTYTVSASSTKAWGGVNSADALLIMKHFVAITPLSGLRLAAADVNGSSTVTAVDALIVAQRFVNQLNSFPVGDWVFEVKNVTIVNTDAVNNFEALCYGDVNGSYTPPYVKTPATVNLNTAGVKEIKSNELFELPISVASDLKVGSISLVVNYPENLYEVEGVVVNAPSSNFLYTAINGELRISWYNMKEMTLSAKDVLLTIQFRSRNISSASANELSLNLDGISELSDRNAVTLQNVNLTYPKLVVAVEEYSISNYPNPFQDVTEISYTLPESGTVSLKVYNLLGEVVSVLVNNVAQDANSYTVTFDGSTLVPGIYTYKIEVNGQSKEFVKSGMMVLSK